MFAKIFVESAVINNPYTHKILKKLKRTDFIEIDKLETIFGAVKKPYLQKRNNLNLFIGRKLGERVKEAPDAYGIAGQKHFYFVHAYNCIYECEYCYLQGYFNSPDIVLFVNHDEIIADMQRIVDQFATEQIWFHAGEFSDSLALSHLTGELALYWDFFRKNDKAKLEIRSKSANTKELLNLYPLENAVISFSLSPESAIKQYDHKTAG
ncbi:MAG: hypothetical protein KDD94_10320, partial [Calditrichaeota bacterium]|nr:hypothetical protein [Calditrichota bacterium]